ncbi:MAG: hypothetical protein H0W90_08030 [Actinobacteria bacterium]|nr:hypothetical protein [Actinomycetota bacterium]
MTAAPKTKTDERDLVLDAPVAPEVEVDLVADAPEIPPALVSIDEVALPGETIRQTIRRLRDEAERERLIRSHGSRRWNQARLAIEQEIAKTGEK